VGIESFEILFRVPTTYVISLSSILSHNIVDSYIFYFIKIWFKNLGEYKYIDHGMNSQCTANSACIEETDLKLV
jgi:hypothetical protein